VGVQTRAARAATSGSDPGTTSDASPAGTAGGTRAANGGTDGSDGCSAAGSSGDAAGTGDGAGDEGGTAADPAAAAGSADAVWTPMGTADTICNGIPKQQKAFLARIVEEMASGERAAYEDWERLDVQPPEPLCLGCFDADAFHCMPIDFWSPGTKFNIEMPCKNHGWAHARYMRTYPAWTQRRSCGAFSDRSIAGQKMGCSECEREYRRLKRLRNAARSHNPRAPRIAELELQMQASSYRSSTLDPSVNKLLGFKPVRQCLDELY